MGSPQLFAMKFWWTKQRPRTTVQTPTGAKSCSSTGLSATQSSAKQHDDTRAPLGYWIIQPIALVSSCWWSSAKQHDGTRVPICSNPIHPSLLSYCINSGRESELPAYFCFPNLRFCFQDSCARIIRTKILERKKMYDQCCWAAMNLKRRQTTGSCGANVEDWMKLVMLLTPNPKKIGLPCESLVDQHTVRALGSSIA